MRERMKTAQTAKATGRPRMCTCGGGARLRDCKPRTNAAGASSQARLNWKKQVEAGVQNVAPRRGWSANPRIVEKWVEGLHTKHGVAKRAQSSEMAVRAAWVHALDEKVDTAIVKALDKKHFTYRFTRRRRRRTQSFGEMRDSALRG